MLEYAYIFDYANKFSFCQFDVDFFKK